MPLLFLRSSVFALISFLLTIPYALMVPVFACLDPQRRYPLIMSWCRIVAKLIPPMLGIRWRIEGLENLPERPSVIFSKHQSALETVLFVNHFPPQSFVLKRELHWVPFFGWALAMLPMIAIDRTKGSDARTQVKLDGAKRLGEGWWVTIYPEGTRVAPGESRRYKLGGATLAAWAGAPIVPVALNTGEFWRRRSLVKHPGLARVIVGPAIETAGRDPVEVNAEAEAWIEATMRREFPHHYRSFEVGSTAPA